jgi:glycosyltransferase involved in cell wall biosynthesis
MEPVVSVVTPAYNALQFLPDTIRSVVNQTFPDFEFIIVDDGSSDGTGEYISNYSDRRIVALIRENRGPSAARNAGITVSRGKYIAFLDADDLWLPQKLDRQVQQMEADSEIGLTHTGISYIDEHSREIQPPLGVSGQGMIRKAMLINPSVRCASTPLIRRSCFAQVGMFSEDLRQHADWDMWLRISEKFKIAIIDEPLTQYRQHSANMTKAVEHMMTEMQTVIERAFERVPESGATLKHRAYGSAYMFAAWRAFYVNDRRMARQLQKSSWSAWPLTIFSRSSLKLTYSLILT